MNAAVPLAARLEEIRSRIGAAAVRSGRSPSDIVLIGVTKTVPAHLASEAVAAGLRDLGENRVQEAEAKVRDVEAGSAVRWHLIGHLQRNKAGRAARLFDRIHGVDAVGTAEALDRHGAAAGRVVRGLAQVNVTGAPGQHGLAPEALEPFLARVAALPGLAIDGLMAIGPLGGGSAEAARCFAATRVMRDRMEVRLGIRLPELSMGMSADYEEAIAEGSTFVRIGSALFGARAEDRREPACS